MTASPVLSPTTSPADTSDLAGNAASGVRRPTQKDLLSNAVILSVAAAAWFGWGQQGGLFALALTVGSLLAVACAVLSILRLRRATGTTTMATDPGARRTYWIAVGVESVLIVGGAITLGRLGHPEFISSWTAAVVGLHFLPLAKAFALRLLVPVGLACAAVAAAAVGLDLAGLAPAPTVAGAGTGVLLVIGALVAIRQADAPATVAPVSR